MYVMLAVPFAGKEAGTIIEVGPGVGDALVNHRKPASVEVDKTGKIIQSKPKKKAGPSEVK